MSGVDRGAVKRSKAGPALSLALYAPALLAIVVALNYFARREPYRAQIDATKTRAYSLSGQSTRLLASLKGDWTIALVMNREKTDRSIRRQIDEVLKRYTDASSQLHVLRIDPADPRTLGEYESLLGRLNAVYAAPIKEYGQALDGGVEAFQGLLDFARQRADVYAQVAARVPASDSTRTAFKQRADLLGLLAQQGNLVLDEVAKSRKTDESKPIPDYEGARSILAQALSQWAGELDELAGVFAKWLERANIDAAARQFATASRQECAELSQRLALAADPLKQLPPMQLSSIGAQLQQGEAAVIVGPDRAAVIPSQALFPKSNIRVGENNAVSFDQRFRGEQLITAAIRSLTVEHMPLVVFVHGDEKPMLKPRDKQADLVGVGSVLKSSRFDVAEWTPATQKERPTGAKGQPVVWVVVPPPMRAGLELTRSERALLDAVSQLVADGEPVLLSVYPSVVTRYGQADPWAAMARPFGLVAETEHVVFENVRVSDTARQTQRGEAVQEFNPGHVISRAVNGQQAYFTLPVPLRTTEARVEGVQASVIAEIPASEDRWLEKEWAVDAASIEAPGPDQRLKSPVAVVMAAERPMPAGSPGSRGRSMQRLVLVGSGGWQLSFVADLVRDIGGGKAAQINPGNYELMLASVSWLAGMDDIIAASPLSQETARLQGLEPETRRLWFWILAVGLPAACMAIGLAVWGWRKR